MYIFLIFNVLHGILQAAAAAGSYASLPIVYNIAKNSYIISDVRIIIQEFSTPRVDNEILLFCGKDENNFYQLDLQQVYESVDAVNVQNVPCKSGHKVHVFQAPKLPQYSFGFGYVVSPRSETIILDKKLAKNVSGLRVSSREDGIIVIWYDGIREPRYHKKTRHRFLNYKRNLIPPTTCDSYYYQLDNASREFNIDNTQYYDIQKHFEILSQFHLPYDSQSHTEYFVKHQMVPTDDFVEDNRRVVTCNDVITVPIWQSISHGVLQKVEKYIQSVAQYVPDGSLLVRTEVIDVLELQKKNAPYIEEVYLESEKGKIPVPKYVVKIVSYKVPNISNKNELDDTYYYMIMVIHNEIGWPSNRLCNSARIVLCAPLGWYITMDEIEIGTVYCCHPGDPELKKNSIDIKFGRDILNLGNIVTRFDENGEIAETIDILRQVEQDTSNYAEISNFQFSSSTNQK